MKILFTIIISFFGITSLKAQTAKLRVNEVVFHFKKGEPITKTADFFITVNNEKSQIRVYGETESTYNLVKDIRNWKDDEVEHAQYKAVDADGEECVVELVNFKNGAMNIGIIYPTFSLVFRTLFVSDH